MLLVAVLVAAWINRDALTFAAKLAVPGPAYSRAADRTSDPAELGGRTSRSRTTRTRTGPPVDDPAITSGTGSSSRERRRSPIPTGPDRCS